MTLLVMGGSAVTLGTISVSQLGHAGGCQGNPPPVAPAAEARCDRTGSSSGGHFSFTGSDGHSGSSTAASAPSARGGFGASGAAHAGE